MRNDIDVPWMSFRFPHILASFQSLEIKKSLRCTTRCGIA
jgi:hypothetical protein